MADKYDSPQVSPASGEYEGPVFELVRFDAGDVVTGSNELPFVPANGL